MNLATIIRNLFMSRRMPIAAPPASFAGQRTNHARNKRRKLVKQLGNRQCRRQFKTAYQRRAMGLASHQALG